LTIKSIAELKALSSSKYPPTLKQRIRRWWIFNQPRHSILHFWRVKRIKKPDGMYERELLDMSRYPVCAGYKLFYCSKCRKYFYEV
jgi:hypothetical protein